MRGAARSWRSRLSVLAGAVFLLVPILATSAEAASCTRQMVGGKWTYYGTSGNDTCTGTSGADVFWTYAGNDTVNGQGGNDEVHVGDGDDTVNAGPGADVLYMGAGDDTAFGGTGNDTMSMGSYQNDVSGVEEAHGEDGNDTINVAVGLQGWGGNGNDFLNMSESGYTPGEPSFFYGGPGRDDADISDGDFEDAFYGGFGNDGAGDGSFCLTNYDWDIIGGSFDPIDFQQDEPASDPDCESL